MIRSFLFAAFVAVAAASCSPSAQQPAANAEKVAAASPQKDASLSAAATATKLLPAKAFTDELVKRKEGEYYLIDVRTEEECAQGMLVSAQQIDFNAADFEQKLAQLDRSREVFIYCKAGGRSAKASKIAEKLGFRAVYEMEGGYDAWMKI